MTYNENPNKDELRQGDILLATKDLQEVLQQHHKYFVTECDVHPGRLKYPYFMVLTQSCDLVKREGNICKTPYITLAAVRPLDVALKKIGEDNSVFKDRTKIERELDIYSNKLKNSTINFLERLINNNEAEYFFIYGDDKVGLDQHYVSFLKVSIALKARENYEVCLAAKRVELAEPFSHKLGWHVGNLYSRIGTEDVSPEKLSELKESFMGDYYKFVTPKAIKDLPENYLGGKTKEEVIKEFEKQTFEEKDKRLAKIAEAVIRIVEKEEIELDELQKQRITNSIKNSPTFKQEIKD